MQDDGQIISSTTATKFSEHIQSFGRTVELSHLVMSGDMRDKLEEEIMSWWLRLRIVRDNHT